MKRSLALLLTSLLLVFSLAACGKDQQSGGVDGNGSVSGSDDAGSGSAAGNGGVTGGAADDSVTGGVNDGASGSLTDGVMDTMDDVGDAARSAVRGAENAVTGNNAGYTNSSMNGYTYDQMLQNGRVF